MSQPLKITVLKENNAINSQVTPGHGLAMLVQYREINILFDTGPDASIVENACEMNVPLTDLDAIVLSHGHYDHTGGLAAILKITGPIRVIAHPQVFDETYASDGQGGVRSIQMPLSREEYEALGAEFDLNEMPVTIADGFMTTGRIPPVDTQQRRPSGLVRRGHSGLLPDDFRDDLSLIAVLQDTAVMITGCAHMGLINTLYKAKTILKGCDVTSVVGGLHLKGVADAIVTQIADEAYDLGVRTMLPCHCTGERAIATLERNFRGNIYHIATGNLIGITDEGHIKMSSY